MHEVLVNRLGGLSLPRKSVDRLTDRPDMTLDVYLQCNKLCYLLIICSLGLIEYANPDCPKISYNISANTR